MTAHTAQDQTAQTRATTDHRGGAAPVVVGNPAALEELLRIGAPMMIGKRGLWCAFADGEYWFAEGYDRDSAMLSEVALVKRQGLAPRETRRRVVPLTDLPTSTADGWTSGADQSTGPHRNTQAGVADGIARRLDTALSEAAQARASDLRMALGERDFRIHAIINDRLHPIGQPWTAEDGRQALQRIFHGKDEGSGQTSYQPRRFQGFSVRSSEQVRLPRGIAAVRGQRGPSEPVGEHMFLRLFYEDTLADADLARLGFDAPTEEVFERTRGSLRGAVIIGGVTGDGKSTTMAANLVLQQQSHGGELNMVTVEDPVEYHIPGATQIAVPTAAAGEERGDAFGEALRHFCRLHPATGMVSEIRDADAAQQVMRFVDTGHQVWTTIHVENALGIPFRLINLGVPTAHVCRPGALALLVKQTLLPILCSGCRIAATETPPPARDGGPNTDHLYNVSAVAPVPTWLAQDLGGLAGVYRRNPEGCAECRGRHGEEPLKRPWWGYTRRQAVAETIIPDLDWLSLVQNMDAIGAWRYWINTMGGRPIDAQATTMVRAGAVDPFDARRKGIRLGSGGPGEQATGEAGT